MTRGGTEHGSSTPPDIDAIVAEVEARLRRAADPARKEHGEGYHPTALEIVGVKVPEIRAIVRDIWRRVCRSPPSRLVDLAQALVDTQILEARQVAYELLGRHRAALASLDDRTLLALGRGIDNWGSVDTFSVLVAGVAWRLGAVRDCTIEGWARSEDRWWRRAAVVSTVSLNQKARGGTGDTPRTLAICELVTGDRDDMVAKALSWALRELSKREPEVVRAFLATHDQVLAARVRREARKKLETGRKQG